MNMAFKPGVAARIEALVGIGQPATPQPSFAALRLAEEAQSIATMKADATPPPAFAAAPVAPAFGLKVPVAAYEIVSGGTRRQVAPHFRRADVFDVIESNGIASAARRGVDYQPDFTPGQVAMARLYRDMVERHGAGGLRGTDLNASGGAGGGGGFIDAHIDLGDRIKALRRAIGSAAALSVRRVRPSARGKVGARVISDRALVDALCLHGLDLNGVLRAAGWSADGHHRKALRQALAAALDRMQGYSDRMRSK